MKQKIFSLGLAAAIIMSTGAIFKVNHWPAAAIMMILGTSILVLLFLPAALIDHYRAEGTKQNKLLYIVTFITCFVVFSSMLYKIMHWPGAGYVLLIALPFPYVIFLPVFLAVTSKNKNFNIYNTVFVLLLVALNSVFAVLLSLNVSKEIVDDSYSISKSYSRTAKAMADLPVTVSPSAVNTKIDEILKITGEYEDLILKNEGMTREQWKRDPGYLKRPENINTAASVLADNGEKIPGMKLSRAITELIDLMRQTKGFEDAAKTLPSILDLDEEKGPDNALNFYSRNIFVPLSWALIYLDGVEANLKMIKASTPSGQ
jgi:hypothetical protein